MNYVKLYETYGQCLYAVAVLSIKGSAVKVPITHLHLSLSMNKSNALSVLYESKEEDKIRSVQQMAKLGALISLSLGYDKTTLPVFLGYLHSVDISQDSNLHRIELYAQDVLGLMMNHQRFVHHKEKKAQAILEEIVKDGMYSTFIKKKNIGQREDIAPSFTQWVLSDYETLSQICRDKDMVFYVRNDEFIIEDVGKPFTPEIIFSYLGIEDIHLVHSTAGIRGTILLQGYDKEYKNIEVKKTVKLPGGICDQSIFQEATAITYFDTIVTPGFLKTKAEQLVQSATCNLSAIQFSCLYVPELQCGRKLDFTAISSIKASCILSNLEVVLDEQQFTCEGRGIVI